MPQLDFVTGDTTLDLSLSSLAHDGIATFAKAQFRFVHDVVRSALDAPIEELASDPFRAEFTASEELKWNFVFGEGALLVRLQPEVNAAIEIRRSGELFAFADSSHMDDDLPLQPPARPQVTPGFAYVSLRFRVKLEASGRFGFAHGLYGIKANVGDTQRFLLAYHHRVAKSTPARDAIQQAFEHFVFPYSAEQAGRIQEGCFSEWEHISKMDVGFSAKVGFGGALLGAYSAAELGRAVASPVGKAALKAMPDLNLGPSFSVSCTHEDAFRTVLSAVDSEHTELFLYKMNKQSLSEGLRFTAAVEVSPVKLASSIKDLSHIAVERLLPEGLPDPGGRAGELMKTVPEDALDSAAKDVGSQVDGFLRKLNILSAEAGITSERINEQQALMSCRITGTTSAGFEAAVAGRLREAVTSHAVEVLPGSFVRDSVTRRSTIYLRLFGVVEPKSVDEYIRSSDMIYEGNCVFRIRYKTGRETHRNFFGHRKQIEVFFTGTAAVFLNGEVKGTDIRLRIATVDANAPEAAHRTAAALAFLLEGRSEAEVAARLREAVTNRPSRTVSLTCSIAPSAFRKLTFTAFEKPDRPRTLPHTNDALNYDAFVKAVNRSRRDPLQGDDYPDLASTYNDWAQFSIATNDRPSAGLDKNSRPNRRHSGNLAVWPQNGRLAGVTDAARRRMIVVYLEAARSFLNSCEDLAILADDADDVRSEEAFSRLASEMDALAQKEIPGTFPLFFGKPTLAALIRQMKPESVKVSASDSAEFAVTVDIA